VLAVIACHFALPGAAGGFAGVDVFFVISGYLITGILAGDLDARDFSLTRFYDRRIRRILPALLVLVAATLIAGFFVLMPGDYLRTGRSALWTIFFAPNIYFEHRTGYFDPNAALAPLLHLWSLGVEEQFYLVWPLLLLALAKLRARRGALLVIALLLTLTSFGLSEWLLAHAPKSAFYAAPSRAWELGLGALVALAPRDLALFRSRLLAEIAPAAGLACILYGMWRLTADMAFPGHNALLPVVGAALIVAPWRDRGLIYKLLSLPPLVFVGLISYSLYLWHWPILVLYRHYASVTDLNVVESAALIALAFVAATLSWLIIERPFRRARPPLWLTFSTAAGATALMCAATLMVTTQRGLPGRIPASFAGISSLDEMWRYDCPQPDAAPEMPGVSVCTVGARWADAGTRVILWGDSHAQSMLPLFATPAAARNIAVLQPLESCVPYISDEGVKRQYPDLPQYTARCSQVRARVLDLMARPDGPKQLILVASWPFHLSHLYRQQGEAMSDERGLALMREGLDELARTLTAHGRRLTLISDIPPRPSDAVTCLVGGRGILRAPCPDGATVTPRAYVDSMSGRTNALLREMPARWANVDVVILEDRMCNAHSCTTWLDNEFLYRDSGHYRRNLTPHTRDRLAARMQLGDLLATGDGREK